MIDFANTVIRGNAFDVLRDIEPHSVSLIIDDMPYNITGLGWEGDIDLTLLWDCYRRVLKPNGVVCLFGNQPFTSAIVQSNLAWFRLELIWKKHKPSNFPLAEIMPLKYHENIEVFYDSKEKITYNPQMIERENRRVENGIKNNGTVKVSKQNSIFSGIKGQSGDLPFSKYSPKEKNPSSIIEIPAVVSTSHEKTPHPTQKPVALYERLINTYSNRGDIVLDNFAGSGTCAIACLGTERKYICIEKDTDNFNTPLHYIPIIQQRIRSFYSNSCTISQTTNNNYEIYRVITPFGEYIKK